MKDKEIVDLYWQRSEIAISETANKYGNYCHTIAYNILENTEDSEECVNDTWLSAWNSMPDKRPERLSPFLGKITRNFAITKGLAKSRQKRGGKAVTLALEDLDECIASGYDLASEIEDKELEQAINRFVKALPKIEQEVFVSRWDLEKTADGVTGRVMQLWYDAEKQEAICVNQANLPTRNDHSESSYTKLQQTSVDGSISWPVYAYLYKCRLGSDTDTNVYWYGVNNIGEDSCHSFLDDVELGEASAVRK